MNNQTDELPFGTPVHKIIHRDAPDTSRVAGLSIDTTKGERRIYKLIQGSESGLTIKEAAVMLNVFPNTISGRFTGLSQKDLIIDSGRRRGKSRVMVTKQ